MNSIIEYMIAFKRCVFSTLLICALPNSCLGASEALEGLPPIRKYPFEGIGSVSRSARLGFDGYDRLVVVEEGVYSVLNDDVWLDMIGQELSSKMARVIRLDRGADGLAYFGGFGDFGLVRFNDDGAAVAESLVGDDAPDWIRTAIFDDIVSCSEGIYFGSWNGVVYYSYEERNVRFLRLDVVRELFRLGEKAYVSTIEGGILGVDIGQGLGIRSREILELEEGMVEVAIAIGNDAALLSDSAGNLWIFDGDALVRWGAQERYGIIGRVSGLESLAGGGVAVSIYGRGVFLFDSDGTLLVSLDATEYHRVHEMGSNEKGVLWIVSSNSVDKVLYGSPLTEYSQRLGGLLNWPQIGFQDGIMYLASDGQFYEESRPSAMESNRFEVAKEQLEGGVRYIASHEGRMLLGNREGIYSMSPSGGFEEIIKIEGLLNIAMLGRDVCFGFGRREIAAIIFENGAWRKVESLKRGLEYAPVAHSSEHFVWVELGAKGVLRFWIDESETIQSEFIENEHWSRTGWVNVGFLEDKVVLSNRESRKVFDETKRRWIDPAEIDKLFGQVPRRIDRVWQDKAGALWATHSEGVVLFQPSEGGYKLDTYGMEMINDRYPRVTIGKDGEVWIVAARSLFSVRAREESLRRLETPTLVSLEVGGERVAPSKASMSGLSEGLTFSYNDNNPSFRFFSGGYGWKESPRFEYRFRDRELWTKLETGSLLAFDSLRNRDYVLEVRTTDSLGRSSAPFVLAFAVQPPWYGSPIAYLIYAAMLIALVLAVAMISSHITRKRNRELEAVVQERTLKLELTMAQLEEKTRRAATLAERHRLAGEVHDSLQQGIIGAIIQLDATLSLPDISRKMFSRLSIVRNMISYVKQEIQHLVWDLDSTLNDKEDLGEVLCDLVDAFNTQKPRISLERIGNPRILSSEVRHNLLRITQESCSNAIRHSRSENVTIQLIHGNDFVELAVEDDGVGFDRGVALSGGLGHFGLRGIKERTEKIGGSLSVRSYPGQGTRVSVVIPNENSQS